MKRVLVAVALGGLLLVGTPTLAASAQKNETRAEKGGRSADKGGEKGKSDDKGGDHRRGGDRDGKDRHEGRDRDGHDRDGDGRHGHYRHGYYYGGDWWYGEPQDCYYGRRGAYNCEPYGGDYYYGGYHPGYGYGYGHGYGHGRPHHGGAPTVVAGGKAFNPPEVSIRPGQEVVWVFEVGPGEEPHTVTADNKSFDSGVRKDGEFRLRFEQPGTYSYRCMTHPETMRGRVLVHG